jgi:hypothetical protein
MSQTPSLFLSVGKQIKDEYGRVIGKIASFAVTPSGKFDAVFVEQGNGKFSRHSVEHLKLDGDDITLISRLKSEASIFCDQIPLIWRKDHALKELSEKKKISPELYQELHNNFDGALTQLKKDAQILVDELDQEIISHAEELKALSYALVHLELEHEIGKIDDQYYETAFTMIQENLKRISVEKGDIEITKIKLSNILLGDTPKIPEKLKPEPSKVFTPTSKPELPEPPVVVYVKEIGRAGI